MFLLSNMAVDFRPLEDKFAPICHELMLDGKISLDDIGNLLKEDLDFFSPCLLLSKNGQGPL